MTSGYMSRRSIAVLAIIPVLAYCSNADNECYSNNYANITSYRVSPTTVLSNGMLLDDPEEMLNPVSLVLQVEALEECLGIDITEECITVVVAPDWYVSPCSREVLFPCDMPDSVCLNKGLTPADLDECPCSCRAIIQDENTIIVAPDVRLFRAELARMVTGINDPWADFAHCIGGDL